MLLYTKEYTLAFGLSAKNNKGHTHIHTHQTQTVCVCGNDVKHLGVDRISRNGGPPSVSSAGNVAGMLRGTGSGFSRRFPQPCQYAPYQTGKHAARSIRYPTYTSDTRIGRENWTVKFWFVKRKK